MDHCQKHTETRELIKEVESGTKSAHHRLDDHQVILSKHSSQLDALIANDSRNSANIVNLICRIDGLIATIKWMIGIMVPTLISIIGMLISLFLRK
jgi:hypothetical protein